MINYKSYGDLSRDVAANLQKIPTVEIVVGVPKSGLIPAIMIASFKNVKFYDLDTFEFAFASRSGSRKLSGKIQSRTKVLVVDDSVNTGAEFARTRAKLAKLSNEFEFIFCAVYGKGQSAEPSAADIILSYVSHPRIFQWNYRNHIVAEHALFDLDGVLCVDPTDDENDDGEAYLKFLSLTAPLTIPVKEISGIVTSRLEKYRSQTEDWLHRNGVKYKELLMLDLPSAEERRRLNAHAPFKAEVFKSRDELLFVESNWKQAKFIAYEADKPVICTENDTLIYGRDHHNALNKTNKLVSNDSMSVEFELQRKIAQLTDRLLTTDAYAAQWLSQLGIKYQIANITELSPFLKARIITSSPLPKAKP